MRCGRALLCAGVSRQGETGSAGQEHVEHVPATGRGKHRQSLAGKTAPFHTENATKPGAFRGFPVRKKGGSTEQDPPYTALSPCGSYHENSALILASRPVRIEFG
jgi:hypothetical protein